MRAVLYARYSSDLQRPNSIADRLMAGRRYADQIVATIVREYSDAAISGSSRIGRPELNQLLADAKLGAFDIVIVEALDRLTRSGGDAGDLFHELRLYGVRLITISEGEVSEPRVGLKGTMNALFLKELALKVQRGADRGRPVWPPLPRRAGWNAPAIIGRPGAVRGILRNPICVGEVVWNRVALLKDRRTGTAHTPARSPRPRPATLWTEGDGRRALRSQGDRRRLDEVRPNAERRQPSAPCRICLRVRSCARRLRTRIGSYAGGRRP